MTRNKIRAILLLGPTGAGKTPFGEALESSSLWGGNYHHFDFGEKLRQTALTPSDSQGTPEAALTEDELQTVRSVLASNSLLDESDFPIAEKILISFMKSKNLNPSSDVIILNGLPRHTAQASALEKIIAVKVVLIFACSPDVIFERIKTNSGGDREGRTDDSLDEIKRKLDIYREKTMPLAEYYKTPDRTILEIAVDADTIPLYIIQSLETMPCMI